MDASSCETVPSCSATPVEEVKPDSEKTIVDWVKEGNHAKVEEMLKGGEDPDQMVNGGWSLIHTACVFDDAPMILLLLKHGASLHSRDTLSNNTPLHYAAHFDAVECCKALVEAGADIEATNEDSVAYISRIPIYTTGGRTPLMMAVIHTQEKATRYLLSVGAQPLKIKDNDGRSAYDLACLKKELPLAPLLNPSANEHKKIDEPEELILKIQARIKTREQTQSLEYKRKLALYKPLHPQIFAVNEAIFDPTFLQALKENSLEKITAQVIPGIHKFRIFSLEFCNLLLEELEHFEKTATNELKLAVRRPNSMNNYGVILDDIGFTPMIKDLLKNYLSPLTKILFPDCFGGSLDQHHCFLVRYKKGEDIDLALHVDDSEVTLNVCLGKEFTGGTLNFYGLKGEPSEKKEEFEFFHEKGIAILHSGKHWHEANKILSGERCNLILWCRSSRVRPGEKRRT